MSMVFCTIISTADWTKICGNARSRNRGTAASDFVTTDLAAQSGLDIPEIAAVVHYHLPLTEDALYPP